MLKLLLDWWKPDTNYNHEWIGSDYTIPHFGHKLDIRYYYQHYRKKEIPLSIYDRDKSKTNIKYKE